MKKGPAHKPGKKAVWPTSEEIACLPWFEELSQEQIVVISTPEKARRAFELLIKEKVVGFDTESKPTFIKGQISQGPHVVQFATENRAYVFLLQQADCRRIVGNLIKSSALKKVGFGLKDDLKRIQSKLHVWPQSVLDLETLFTARGFGRGVGVKVAVALIFKRRFKKSKKTSTSNWASPFLSPQQIRYAANDAFAAIKVYRALSPAKQ